VAPGWGGGPDTGHNRSQVSSWPWHRVCCLGHTEAIGQHSMPGVMRLHHCLGCKHVMNMLLMMRMRMCTCC
jgi:hypothetical protein